MPTWWTAPLRAGHAVLGLPSSGLHANGFTLVRGLLGDDDFDPDLLLPPTRLYLEDVRRLRASCGVRALAHVTGGGIPGNLPRVLPAGLGARLDPGDWERHPSMPGWTSAACRRRSSAASSTSASASARSWRRRTPSAPASPVIGQLEAGIDGVAGPTARDRRPRLRAGFEPAGADRPASPDRRRRRERARRRSARPRRARGDRDGRLSPRGVPGARRSGPRHERAGWPGTRSSSSSAPGTCTCSRPRSWHGSPRSTSTPRSCPLSRGRRRSRTPWPRAWPRPG